MPRAFSCAGADGQQAPESERIKTIASLKKLDDFPLYTMHFYGDYDLPDYADEGSRPQDIQIENQSDDTSLWACTCFSAQGEFGNQLLARNFDWQNHPTLLLFTDPPGRYASVAMVDISYLGYSKSENPGKDPGIESWKSFVQKILDSMPLVDRNQGQAI